MDGRAFSGQLKRLGVSPREFAEATEWDRRTIVRWLKTRVPDSFLLPVFWAIQAHDKTGLLPPMARFVRMAPRSGRLLNPTATRLAYEKAVEEGKAKSSR